MAGKRGAPVGNKNAAGGLGKGLLASGQQQRKLSGAMIGASGTSAQQSKFITGATARGGIGGGLKGAAVGAVVGGLVTGGPEGLIAGAALGGSAGAAGKGMIRKSEAKKSVEYGKSLKSAIKPGDIAGMSQNLKAYSEMSKKSSDYLKGAMSIANKSKKK